MVSLSRHTAHYIMIRSSAASGSSLHVRCTAGISGCNAITTDHAITGRYTCRSMALFIPEHGPITEARIVGQALVIQWMHVLCNRQRE